MGMIFWKDQMPWPKQSHNDTSAESQTSQGRQPAWRGRWKAYVCSQAQFISVSYTHLKAVWSEFAPILGEGKKRMLGADICKGGLWQRRKNLQVKASHQMGWRFLKSPAVRGFFSSQSWHQNQKADLNKNVFLRRDKPEALDKTGFSPSFGWHQDWH